MVTEKDKIAAIGPRRQVLTFQSIGLKTFEVEDGAHEEAVRVLGELAGGDGPGVILISESLAEGIGADFISDIRLNTGTVIMAVPSHEGATGLTASWLKEAMERSIGVDLISE